MQQAFQVLTKVWADEQYTLQPSCTHVINGSQYSDLIKRKNKELFPETYYESGA